MPCKANGKEHLRQEVIEGYGHFDCIAGRRAYEDVFARFAEAPPPANRWPVSE